ncbi:hypothetical protein HEP_00435500 [Hepatocystis sp. ex Piliocolobus tephrosceles]|nr:hypothetical protein HEP_00435500 [Hepatocystis sp. ex Piliocolobus tephrosceles]
MLDANDVIKEIIYRSADECNYNNEELNFTSILKYFYDVTNKYNIKKELYDDIFNKLLIICKNIIDDKITYEYPKDVILPVDNCLTISTSINNTNSTTNFVFDKNKIHYYKDVDKVHPLNDTRLSLNLLYENDTCDNTTIGIPFGNKSSNELSYNYGNSYKSYNSYIQRDNISINNNKKNELINFATLKKMEDNYYTNTLLNAKKYEHVNELLPLINRNKETKIMYKNLYDLTDTFDSNKLIINEKSFLHKNNKNLLKIYLNGDYIYNVYNKVVRNIKRYDNSGSDSFDRTRLNKVKIYNESNVLFTFYTLRKMYNGWFNYFRKKKKITKHMNTLKKKFEKKLLLKYYDNWVYNNEKRLYIKKWKSFAKKEKILTKARNKIEKKRKKIILTIWKNRFNNKLDKQKRYQLVTNVYYKNLLIKCYVHFSLFCKKRRKEKKAYNNVYSITKHNLNRKYFFLFTDLYKEEIFFKKYYIEYIKKVKHVILQKFFFFLKCYINKRKQLKSNCCYLENKRRTNLVSTIFINWFVFYIKKEKYNNIIQIVKQKKVDSMLQKSFFCLVMYKNKSINLKKKYLYLYEKKNKQQIQTIYNKWKTCYTINSTQYIFLYNKYKYKLLIHALCSFMQYNKYKKNKKQKIHDVKMFFKNKIKKKVLKKWLLYIHMYKKNILNYYNFKDTGNLAIFFLLKLLLNYKYMTESAHCKSFF